jgi:hypothetical protein
LIQTEIDIMKEEDLKWKNLNMSLHIWKMIIKH